MSSSSSTPTNEPSSVVLPKGWIRTYSNSQKRYYYSHKDTKHTQWHFPTASEAADPWMAKRRAEENQQKQQQQQQTTTSASASKRPREDDGAGDNPSRQEQQPNRKKPAPNHHNSGWDDNTSQQQQHRKQPPPASSKGYGTDGSIQKNNNPNGGTTTRTTNSSHDSDNLGSILNLADTTNVAIIVPFRDLHTEQHRSAHLRRFVPHMVSFLSSLQKSQHKISDYHIYIVEQSNDGRKFNRGKLLNIGFDLARKNKRTKHDVFIFHDVDLLPQMDLADAYSRFPKVPYHIARVWDRYSNNPKYFGGVVSFSSSDFKRINGYPNTFWGWGGEDDELQLRCNALGIKWDWPRPGSGTLIDLEDMTLQEKLTFLKHHREWKCMVKWEALEEHGKTWKTNGLADLSYKVLETTPLDTKDLSKSKATKITVDVKLNGNHWANDKCSVDYVG